MVEPNGAFGSKADASEWLEAEETADAVVSVFCSTGGVSIVLQPANKKNMPVNTRPVFMTPPYARSVKYFQSPWRIVLFLRATALFSVS
jgi:hypothetical protein